MVQNQQNIDEDICDPILYTLYCLVLNWALDQSNFFVWFWTLCQWHCMAWSANIYLLQLNNIRLGVDSLNVKYNDTKMDKQAEWLSEKNIFANHLDWKLCFWTGLSIWISLRSSEMFRSNPYLFWPNFGWKFVEKGIISYKYCNHLIFLFISSNRSNFTTHGKTKIDSL